MSATDGLSALQQQVNHLTELNNVADSIKQNALIYTQILEQVAADRKALCDALAPRYGYVSANAPIAFREGQYTQDKEP